MGIKQKAFCLIFLIQIAFIHPFANAQSDTANLQLPEVNKARLNGIIIGGSIIYASSMTGLYHLWYKNYPQSNFHFINDNNEWLFMDKAGHTTTSYYLGLLGYESLRWAGLSEKKSTWYGGSFGFAYLTVIEILDGFSKEWGASGGDLIANGTGTALFIGQQLAWKEQRILLKYSFHLTDYAQYNPELLGKGFVARLIKDYNGQTVWLSGNISSFLPEDSRFPKWLNFSIGYGAEGMTGAANNPQFLNDQPIPSFNRYRQFYIAPDIDLTRIKTRNNTLNYVLKTFGFLKFPLPTIEINKKGIKFHPLYF